MIGRTNTGGGGFAYGMIVVNYPAGSALTIQRISGTGGNPTKKDTITTGDTYTRIYYAKSAGTYRLTIIDGAYTNFKDVTISSWGQSETVTLVFIGYFYWLGNQYTDVTGGYSAVAQGTLRIYEEEMGMESGSANTERWAASENAVDLTNYSTLYFSAHANTNTTRRVAITSVRGGSTVLSAEVPQGTSYGEVSLNIANLTGLYYLQFSNASSGASRTYVNKIWAEP